MTWFCPGYEVGILFYNPSKYLSKHLLLYYYATFLLSNVYFFGLSYFFWGCPNVIPTFLGLSYFFPRKSADFSDFWSINGDRMDNLGLIDFKIGLYIKITVNTW